MLANSHLVIIRVNAIDVDGPAGNTAGAGSSSNFFNGAVLLIRVGVVIKSGDGHHPLGALLGRSGRCDFYLCRTVKQLVVTNTDIGSRYLFTKLVKVATRPGERSGDG